MKNLTTLQDEKLMLGRGTGLNFIKSLVPAVPTRSRKPEIRSLSQVKSGKPGGLTVETHELRVEVVEHHGMKWVNVERPGADEIAWLQQNYAFDPLHLEDITGRLQRPKIDDFEENYLFLVLHFPVFNKTRRVSHAEEVDIFIGPGYLITVHDGKLRPLARLFEQCKGNPGKRHGLMGRGSSFLLYKIVDVLVDYCFPIVNKLGEKLEELDEEIFTSTSKDTIHDISMIRRDILAVRRILKPQISVLASLERRKRIVEEDAELEGYFADITDHISKIWDSLEEYKEVIEGLSSTYDSLTSHRLNQIIKALTMISVIMLPLTLISGLYGMNVTLPFQDTGFAFFLILTLMVVISAVMILFFRWRKWV